LVTPHPTSFFPVHEPEAKDVFAEKEDTRPSDTALRKLGKGGPTRLSEEDYTCSYSPLNWTCKGYDTVADYQFFDGTPSSVDQRFLIDLDTGSMDG